MHDIWLPFLPSFPVPSTRLGFENFSLTPRRLVDRLRCPFKQMQTPFTKSRTIRMSLTHSCSSPSQYSSRKSLVRVPEQLRSASCHGRADAPDLISTWIHARERADGIVPYPHHAAARMKDHDAARLSRVKHSRDRRILKRVPKCESGTFVRTVV